MEGKAHFKILFLLSLVSSVVGHGRLIDPPSRNSAWRFGFPNPPHYTDNELNCGGFNVQWKTNGGKCGVCGDPYHEKNQPHIWPGKYANGIKTKTYREGQEIEVLIEITSNHKGTFFFRIGELKSEPITEKQLVYQLKQPDGSVSWELPEGSGNDVFKIKLKLPAGLTCSRCVLRWWERTGNNWGCANPSNCGQGGNPKQETFVNYADVAIIKKDGSLPPTRFSKSTKRPRTKPPPTDAPNPSKCRAIGHWRGNASMDNWCQRSCGRGYCPSNMSACN
ncbi:uncharacterized protein [Montipora foliosa]|uniref:uncharacterized protein n=1 Tax=Montipora foliosa TaxID=591990 RepID=UPI0035F18665